MQYVPVFDPVRPFGLKVERIRGSQDSGACNQFRGRRAADAKEFSFLGLDVVIAGICVQLIGRFEMFQVYVPFRMCPIRVGVVPDLISTERKIARHELGVAVQQSNVAIRILAY